MQTTLKSRPSYEMNYRHIVYFIRKWHHGYWAEPKERTKKHSHINSIFLLWLSCMVKKAHSN